LRGLGFGRPLLTQLADKDLVPHLRKDQWLISTSDMDPAKMMALARELAEGASPASAGLLLLSGEDNAVAAAHPPASRRPVLVVGEKESGNYVGPILWLNALKAFAGLAEEGAPSSDAGAGA